MNHDIYICYTEEDKAVAKEICQAIEQQEITCWLNSRNIDMNKSYARSIIEAINNCKCVVVIISASANESSQIEYEIDLAYKNNKKIISFVVENTSINNILNYYLSSKNSIIAYPDYPSSIINLEKLVCNIIKKTYHNNEEQQELVPYASNGKMGFVDKNTMEIIIPCEFGGAIKFVGNYGAICQSYYGDSGIWYLINKKGEILKEFILLDGERIVNGRSNINKTLHDYEDIKGAGLLNNFHNGNIIICKGEHQWGIIGLDNLNEITEFKYDHIYCGEHFFIPIKNNKLGIISFKGEIISHCIYDRINDFTAIAFPIGGILRNKKPVSCYRAVIYNDQDLIKKYNGEFNPLKDNLGDSITYILDLNGNIINKIPTTPQEEKEEDLYNFKIGAGFINKNNSIVIPSNYETSLPFSEGLAAVSNNCRWGYINMKGEEVIPCKYHKVFSFSKGLALVIQRDFPSKLKFGFIDIIGNEVIPCIYDYARDFSEGLASVCLNGKWGFIDPNGQLVIPCSFSYAESFSNGLSLVVDTDIIQEPEYDYRSNTFINFDYKDKNVKYGFIDKTGKLVIPFIYEKPATHHFAPNYHNKTIPTKFQEGIIKIFKNNEWGIINNTGKEIVALGRYQSIENFEKGVAKVYQNRKCGLINIFGNEIVPLGKYSNIEKFENKLAKVYQNERCGLINCLGEEVIPCKYREINVDEDGFIVASESYNGNYSYYNNKWEEISLIEYHKIKKNNLDWKIRSQYGLIPIDGGVIDVNGNLIVPTIFDNIREHGLIHNPIIDDIINKGIIPIHLNGVGHLSGFVDQFGNNTLKVGQGLFPCIDKYNKKFGYKEKYIYKKTDCYINESYETTLYDERIKCKYDCAFNIINGFGRVKLNGKWGFVNTLGKEIAVCKYGLAKDFSQGRGAVCTDNGWGFIDINGEEVIPCQYNEVDNFSGGMARVCQYYKYGFIDRNGQIVIPIEYNYITYFSEDLAGVQEGNKWGYIDKDNNIVIPFIYDEISAFNNGIARVKKDKDYIFINKKGEEIQFNKYKIVGDFSEDLIVISSGGKNSWINSNEELLIPFKYTHAGRFEDGIAKVGYKQKYGYINKEGKEIIPLEYDETWKVSTNLIAVKLDNKCALMDLEGKLLTKYKFDTIYRFQNGIACVQEGGRWSFINENGKYITNFYFEEVYGFYNGFGVVKFSENHYEYIDRFGNISDFKLTHQPF